MTVTSSHSSIQYPQRTVLRAERAMRCAPFQLQLFADMVTQSVSLKEIAATAGIRNQYTEKPLLELRVESDLLWLIQVGLLRREVDGQGLTDSFRVTPLGRQLIECWQQLPRSRYLPSGRDRLANALTRWFRLPF